MFDHRSPPRTFFSAPQSVTSLVAAILEPGITIAVFLLAALALDEPLGGPTWCCACWSSR
jgi:putative colanic acid biosynthesis UDP-glucose lipid carrier transferase